jgi:uncharacterized protein YndB with AHSA1/START domain
MPQESVFRYPPPAKPTVADEAKLAQHGQFTVERTFKSPPAKVFQAFADVQAKKKWFGGEPGVWEELIRDFDFREGGHERVEGRWHNGFVSDFRCRYHEIIPNRRIVYAYEMVLNGVRASVSLATIEIAPQGSGSKLSLTEQGVYLVSFDPNGDDHGSRLRGTQELMDRMVKSVDG